MLPEPWNTFLFLVGIPVVVQIIKLIQDRRGKTIGKLGNQLISLVLAGGFLLASGGFAGVDLPAVPVLVAGDLMASVEVVLLFLSSFTATLLVIWGTMSGLYELVYDRLFQLVPSGRFVTADKLASG